MPPPVCFAKLESNCFKRNVGGIWIPAISQNRNRHPKMARGFRLIPVNTHQKLLLSILRNPQFEAKPLMLATSQGHQKPNPCYWAVVLLVVDCWVVWGVGLFGCLLDCWAVGLLGSCDAHHTDSMANLRPAGSSAPARLCSPEPVSRSHGTR